jgi:CSLREA domain-containing protein
MGVLLKIRALCSALVVIGALAGAQAETLTVTSAADAGGSCPGASCTLRQAIATAASGDTINFAAGITTIDLTSDELLINKSLTVAGPGANLLTVRRSDAAGNFRIFNTTSDVTISGLTIANGIAGTGGGGGITNGSGTVTVTNCTLSGNSAIASSGVIANGGGIANGSGTVNVTNCTLSGNSATALGIGGGISNSSVSGGTVNVTNSTLSGNIATGNGGGIFNNGGGTVTITNSTITGNMATTYTSGGSTFPGDGGGIANFGSGSTVNARNTIIAKNTAMGVGPDCIGTLTSQGFNLIGNTADMSITGTTTGNQLNVDPKLGPLQDNGGPTFTHALLSGSPAIEAGESSGSNTDQRGFTRPVNTPAITNATGGDGSDIGAYEVRADQLPGCGNTVVTNNSDSGAGSLRFVFANACDGETITFAPSVVSPINLTSSELLINKAMTISGPGANLLTVQRGAAAGSTFRIFHITSGGFNFILGLTIANGDADNGGGIYNQFGSNLTVMGCTISGNSAGSVGGGGIGNIGAATTIINSTISGNSSSTLGGGIANAFGTVTITNSTISGNSAIGSGSDGGGGIYNGISGAVNLTNSTITNNSASNFGGCGGVQNPSGAVNARNTIIALNTGASFTFPDFTGTLTSQGFNFIGNSQGATITPAQFTDQIGTGASPKDPLLGPLQYNGGATKTHALLVGSTAIDKGDSGGSSTDQRGFTRPADLPGITNVTGGDASDIGAFEVPATVLANISTRLRVGTGDNVLIGGIIVTGTQAKKIIVRAIGPSLPFTDKLADPILELHDSSGALLEGNDNWIDSPNKTAIIDSTIPPTNDLESAIVRSVAPGAYTAIVRGVSNGTGLGVVEVYDLDPAANSKLANIATRGLVQTGDNVLIAGTIVVGQVPQKVIVRAIGPSLSVPGSLADPTLELHDGSGTTIAVNDNWKTRPDGSSQEAEIIATTIPPTNDFESAIVATLPADNAQYTAIVRGVGGTTGIAVVEVYALN